MSFLVVTSFRSSKTQSPTDQKIIPETKKNHGHSLFLPTGQASVFTVL